LKDRLKRGHVSMLAIVCCSRVAHSGYSRALRQYFSMLEALRMSQRSAGCPLPDVPGPLTRHVYRRVLLACGRQPASSHPSPAPGKHSEDGAKYSSCPGALQSVLFEALSVSLSLPHCSVTCTAVCERTVTQTHHGPSSAVTIAVMRMRDGIHFNVSCY
jgi:hypothetical protein